MELYAWQRECLDVWEANDYKGTVQVVTGAGKTFLALNAIKKLQSVAHHPFRVKVVVPTSALLRQWSRSFKETLHVKEIGLCGEGLKSSSEKEYMIYIINSARNTLAKQVLEDFKAGYDVFLILDECHRYSSLENRKIFEFVSHMDPSSRFYSLGLSATATYQHLLDSNTTAVLGKIIYQYGFSKAVEENTVSPFVLMQVSLSFNAEESLLYEEYCNKLIFLKRRLLQMYPELKKEKDFFEAVKQLAKKEEKQNEIDAVASAYLRFIYKRRSLCLFANYRYPCALAILRQLPSNEKVIIFTERIRQSQILYAKLSEQYPNKISLYHSKLGKEVKKNDLERFRTGETRILVTCKGLDEGMDVPDAGVGIVLSSSRTSRQRIQRLGRILRKSKGKDIATLYYFYVSNAIDDHAYLPDSKESYPICHLTYRGVEDVFIHPLYEPLATKLLQDSAFTTSQEKTEMRHCLEEGLILSDWLMEENILNRKIKNATTVHEKNYWLCIKKLHFLYFSQ